MLNGFSVFLEELAHIILHDFTKVLVLSMSSYHSDITMPEIAQLRFTTSIC